MKPTTKIEAVNAMLATVGEAPINTLIGVDVVDALTAIAALDEVTREILVEGWAFNTDVGYPLPPNADSPYEIPIPLNALEVIPASNTYTVRSGKLYDTARFSYSFRDFDPISVTITWGMDFDDLPERTRQYVAIRAGRRFQGRIEGSTVVNPITEEAERRAMWNHRKTNVRVRKKSYLLGSQAVRAIAQTR